jgi:hypothetical protein
MKTTYNLSYIGIWNNGVPSEIEKNVDYNFEDSVWILLKALMFGRDINIEEIPHLFIKHAIY